MKYFSTLACSATVEKLNRQTLICALAAQWPVAPARDGVWFCLRRLPPRPRRSSLDLVWFPDWESGHDWITGGHLHDYVCGTSREFNSAFSLLAADDGQYAQSAEKTGGHQDNRGSILALL